MSQICPLPQSKGSSCCSYGEWETRLPQCGTGRSPHSLAAEPSLLLAVIKTPSPSLLTNLSLKVQMIPKQRNVIRIQLLGIAISLLTLAGKWLNISIHLQGHDRISSGFCHCTVWWLPGHGRNPACKPSAQPSSHCSENANCQQFELEQQLQWNKVEINPLSHPAPFPHRNKLVEPPFIIKCQKNPKQQGQKKSPTFCCANNHNTARKTFIF